MERSANCLTLKARGPFSVQAGRRFHLRIKNTTLAGFRPERLPNLPVKISRNIDQIVKSRLIGNDVILTFDYNVHMAYGDNEDIIVFSKMR